MGRTGSRRTDVVERKVTVGHGIDRVGRGLRKAKLARHQLAIGVEVDARERAGAERQVRALTLYEREALAIAREHPEVREQMVAEIHRLRALQVRVARERPVDVLLGALQQRRHQPYERLLRLPRTRAREQG